MTAFWHRQLPFSFRNPIPAPLHNSKPLQRDNRHDDFTSVQWKTLLAEGDDTSPSLSLRSSEERFLASCGPAEPRIMRTWDVDSFLARATTLAVHKGGFHLAYRPPFLRRITQNQRVLFNGYAIHKLKQLRLGHGVMSGGSNYNCHLILPHMSLGHDESTHLSSATQAVWIDEIVLPALRASCPPDVLQHHPRSFADATGKTTVKKEIHPQGSSAFIDLRYIVPERFLRAFWTEILQRCNRRREDQTSAQTEFRDPFLVITAHDLKLLTKRDTASEARTDFVQHLQQCFHWHSDNFPSQDCWLDFGLEDTPLTTRHDSAVTLLRKTACLRDWSHQFRCPTHVSALIITRIFPWALTRDASTASVELRGSNDLRNRGQMIFHKSYSLHKDLWATSMKGMQPFGNTQLEALEYSQELLDRWYAAAKQFNPRKREWLVKVLQRTKNRISAALSAFMNINFGVRQEYRIR